MAAVRSAIGCVTPGAPVNCMSPIAGCSRNRRASHWLATAARYLFKRSPRGRGWSILLNNSATLRRIDRFAARGISLRLYHLQHPFGEFAKNQPHIERLQRGEVTRFRFLTLALAHRPAARLVQLLSSGVAARVPQKGPTSHAGARDRRRRTRLPGMRRATGNPPSGQPCSVGRARRLSR